MKPNPAKRESSGHDPRVEKGVKGVSRGDGGGRADGPEVANGGPPRADQAELMGPDKAKEVPQRVQGELVHLGGRTVLVSQNGKGGRRLLYGAMVKGDTKAARKRIILWVCKTSHCSGTQVGSKEDAFHEARRMRRVRSCFRLKSRK